MTAPTDPCPACEHLALGLAKLAHISAPEVTECLAVDPSIIDALLAWVVSSPRSSQGLQATHDTNIFRSFGVGLANDVIELC